MMKNIDCLFIGYNEIDFNEYVNMVKKNGENTGTFHDLNIDFLQYKNTPYHMQGLFNTLCNADKHFNPLHFTSSLSLTIAYLSTYLYKRGFTFDYINSFQDEKESLIKKLAEENILAIGIITTYYFWANPIIEIMEFIKRYNKKTKIIIGGPYVSGSVRKNDDKTINNIFRSIGADFFVNNSQGEYALVKILESLKENSSYDQIDNIYYKSNDSYVYTRSSQENNNITENPVDWALFNDDKYDYAFVRTAISCPFKCSFCDFHEHAGKYQIADVDVVIKELDSLSRIESIRRINFIDDTFNVPVERFKKLLKMMIQRKYRFKWDSFLRCQFIDRETVELMKESGCEGVFLGIESGSNQILKNMNKSVTIEKYKEGIALLKDHGFIILASVIIGFPGETFETVKETVDFIQETGVDFYFINLWYYNTIAPIWRDRGKYNILNPGQDWSHATMNSNEAIENIKNAILLIENSVRLPRYNFSFQNIFQLIDQGLTLSQIKNFFKSFNLGIKEKIINPHITEASEHVIEAIKESVLLNQKEFDEFFDNKSKKFVNSQNLSVIDFDL